MTSRQRIAAGVAGLAAATALAVPLGLTSGGGSVDVFVGSTPTPTATATSTPTATPTATPVSCDQTVSTRAALATALGTTSSSGDTICVNTDLTGADLIVTTAMTAQTRVIAQPANQTINMVSVNFADGAAKITLEGFEFTGEHGVWFGGTTNDIHYIRNYCHDQQATCISSTGTVAVNGFWALGSTFQRIEYNGEFGNGYGVYGPNFNDLKLNYNHCDGGSDGTFNLMSDCWEIDGADGFEMIGNFIENDDCLDCGVTHTDGFMFWAGSSDGLIQNNVVVDSAQTTLSPDGSDITVDNNLVVRMHGTCLDVHPNGSSGDVQPLRFTFTNNTVWDCGFSAVPMNGALAGRGSNVWTGNLFEDASCVSAAFTSASGNVFGSGNPCSLSTGSNSFNFTPNWNGTNTGDEPTFQPTNLPTGYEGAGYQPAPYGPDACPC